LCEVLTGQPAYTGRSQAEVMRQAMRGDTADALARLDACGADGELIALAKNCLAIEAEGRPRDAGVVAGRVAGYLAGAQERRRAAERARAAADARAEEERKRRRLAQALAAAVLAMTTAAGIGIVLYQQARRDASARLELAMNDAAMRHSEARVDANADAARWSAAVLAANRLKGLLGPLIDAAARREVMALVDQIAVESHAAEEDRMMLSAVRDVRWMV